MKAKFKIAEEVFPVSKAVLNAKLRNEGLIWSLEIVGGDGEMDGEYCSPIVSSRDLFGGPSKRGATWLDLFDTPIISNADDEPERCGWLYVFEHFPMLKSEITIGRNEGSEAVEIRWIGKGQTDSDEVVDVVVEADCEFVGIYTVIEEESTARRTLDQYLDEKLFSFHRDETSDGIWIFREYGRAEGQRGRGQSKD